MSDNDDEEAVRWVRILKIKNIYQISFGSSKKFSSVLQKNRAFVSFFVHLSPRGF